MMGLERSSLIGGPPDPVVTVEDTPETGRSQALKDAAYASLQGSAKSKAAQALVRAACAQLATYEREHGTHQHRPGPAVEEAVGAFLADLLVAQSGRDAE